LLTICSATAQVAWRGDPQSRQADLAMLLLPLSGRDRYARTPQYGLDPFPGFTFAFKVLQPRSVGTLHIQSREPLQQAAMDPKYLSHEADHCSSSKASVCAAYRTNAGAEAAGGSRDAARTGGAGRGGAARLHARNDTDELAHGRHLQDGRGCASSGRSRAESARLERIARDRLLGLPDHTVVEHEHPDDSDRREGAELLLAAAR
jgi:hypothetical protein